MPTFVVVVLALLAAHDWRTLGRLHPATLWGGLTLLVLDLATSAFAQTEAARTFAWRVWGWW